MSWGNFAAAALNAGASYYAANQAGKAATKGGEQAAAGSEASNNLLREFYNRDEARQQPFYQAGLTAQNQYMAMLGLQPPTQGGQTQTQRYGGYQQQQQQATPTEWLSGRHGVNQGLYDSDPRYKYAWDQATSEHQNQFGKGYNNTSDVGAITSRLQTLYGSQQAPQGQSGGYQTTTQAPMSQQDAFAQFRSTPGYQFGLDEGTKSVEASAAARGGLNSGATLKALQRYGNDYADQQGYTPYMNKLAGLFGGAQTAAGQMGQAGQQYGGQMGQNMQAAGIARGNSTYAAGQAKQQGYANAGSFLNDAWGAYQQGRG